MVFYANNIIYRSVVFNSILVKAQNAAKPGLGITAEFFHFNATSFLMGP
jgi:hypothetical protein